MPADARGRSEATEWLFAALNSVEIFSAPWSMLAWSPDTRGGEDWKRWDGLLKPRLKHLDTVPAGREWLAGTFSIADIMMCDVLRLPDRFGGLMEHPACRSYVARATARPGFAKAYADQMAHFAAADAKAS